MALLQFRDTMDIRARNIHGHRTCKGSVTYSPELIHGIGISKKVLLCAHQE